MEVPVLRATSKPLGYLDELEVGQKFDIGMTRISRDDALAFANIFDPLSFHVDEKTAKNSIFGGLIVSGLQTISTIMALSVKGGFTSDAVVACGVGIEKLKFLKPVWPDDMLSATAEILEVSPARGQRNYGVVRLDYRVFNQDNVLVLTLLNDIAVRVRPTPAP